MAKLIERDRWLWDWGVTEGVVSITPGRVLDRWKLMDPRTNGWWVPAERNVEDREEDDPTRAWYNVITYFAKSRAEALGLTDAIRPAEWKTCPLGGHRFVEDSLWVPPARVYGVDRITHCSPCLEDAVHGEGNPGASGEEVLGYARKLSAILGKPPTQRQAWPQSFRLVCETGDVRTRIRYVEALARKPALRRVRELFGTWREARLAASRS